MSYRGVWLIFFGLVFSGCAALEEPRWALLGDTTEKAFFIDREDVQRLTNGNYRYPVKIYHYQDDQLHQNDESRETNTVLLVEMNCREKRWIETGSDVMHKDNKLLFRRVSPLPTSLPIESGTIQAAAYDYLCNDSDIVAQHNH